MNAQPVFLIAGGDTRQMTEDFRASLEALGKPDPKVAYVGAANKDNKVFFHLMKQSMMKAGAAEVTLAPIANKRADEAAVRKTLSAADVIFLSGGEVEDGITGLKKYSLDIFLSGLFHAGKPFIGVSAGAIMMGRHWAHWDKEGDDNTASLFDCLNFIPMVFDAHGEKEEWKELKCVLRLMGPGAEGHGLTKDGFFKADPSGGLISFRNAPAVFRNVGGEIKPVNAE